MHTIYCIEITCCEIWNLETTIENKHQKYNPFISIPNHKGWKANLSINIPTRVQGKHKYRFWSSKTLTSSNLPLENLVKSIHRNATKCLTSYSKQNKIKPKWSDSHTSNVTNHTHGFSHTHTHTSDPTLQKDGTTPYNASWIITMINLRITNLHSCP